MIILNNVSFSYVFIFILIFKYKHDWFQSEKCTGSKHAYVAYNCT